jgi:FkbM family methyltransferase
LRRGYNVVAIEGDPSSVDKGRERFRKQIADGKLVLINKAITDKKGPVEFFVSEEQPHRGSCFKHLAEYDGFPSKSVSVQSTSFKELCDEFGVPFYVKVDIDGCEIPVVQDLFKLKVKPQYISTEIPKKYYAGIFSWLFVSGYRKFQFKNQANNKLSNHFHPSGSFGDDLPTDRWITIEELMSRYMKFRELRDVDHQNLTIGWLDLHASL